MVHIARGYVMPHPSYISTFFLIGVEWVVCSVWREYACMLEVGYVCPVCVCVVYARELGTE